MGSFCPLCGTNHESTGCPAQPTYHMPAKTIFASEPMEVCPVCHGSGLIAASIRHQLANLYGVFSGLFKK